MLLVDTYNKAQSMGFNMQASNQGNINLIPFTDQARSMLKNDMIENVPALQVYAVLTLLEMGIE